MENINKSKRRLDWCIGICGAILLISFLIFLIVYFKNVSVGEWLMRETYSTSSEYLKQVGFFIATILAFERMITFAFDAYGHLPILHKKHLEDLQIKK